MAGVPLTEMERALSETLGALEPVLDKIVLVGGWVPYLYQKHLWKELREDVPMTQDIDLGVRDTGHGNMESFVSDPSKPGYAGLTPFLERFGGPDAARRQLKRLFDPLLEAIR